MPSKKTKKGVNLVVRGGEPKLKNAKFEKTLKEVFSLATELKDMSKMNMIHLTHSPEPKETMSGLRSSMETRDVLDMYMNIVASKSPLTVDATTFAEKTLENHMRVMLSLEKNKFANVFANQNYQVSRQLLEKLEEFKKYF